MTAVRPQGMAQPAAPQAPVGRLTPIGGSMTPQSAAPILQGAQAGNVVTPQDAERVRASLGPNGQAAFQRWMQANNIVIGGQ